MSMSHTQVIVEQAGQIARLETDVRIFTELNKALKNQIADLEVEKGSLLQQVQDLQFQLNSERALFDKLTLLEEPPRGDDDTTLFDIKPASGE